MHRDDLAAVLSIEEETYSFPWTLGIFRDCLHVGYNCWVYETGNQIEAYGVMSMGAGEAHILTLVVQEASRGKGLGSSMLQHLIDIARRHKAKVVLLEVRPSNTVAIHLYHKLGFSEVGLRPNYYPASRGREDALIMAMSLVQDPSDYLE